MHGEANMDCAIAYSNEITSSAPSARQKVRSRRMSMQRLRLITSKRLSFIRSLPKTRITFRYFAGDITIRNIIGSLEQSESMNGKTKGGKSMYNIRQELISRAEAYFKQRVEDAINQVPAITWHDQRANYRNYVRSIKR